MNVVLQPCGKGDPQAHFEATVESPVDLALIAEYLPARVVDRLRTVSDQSDDIGVMTWGWRPGADGGLKTSWDRIGEGDYAAFCAENRVFFVGEVGLTYTDHDLALRLWGFHSSVHKQPRHVVEWLRMEPRIQPVQIQCAPTRDGRSVPLPQSWARTAADIAVTWSN